MSEIPPGLREHFQQHNRRATFLAIGCLFGSVVSWVLTYVILLWIELLSVTTVRGIDAPDTLSIRNHFIVVVVILLIIGSLVRKWKTQNEKFHIGIALFTILSIPARLTYAVWGNLLARVSPSDEELANAWLVLDLLRQEKKIATTNLPAFLTSGKEAERIAYLLAITELIDTDKYSGIYYHHLRNDKAERLVSRWSQSLFLKG